MMYQMRCYTYMPAVVSQASPLSLEEVGWLARLISVDDSMLKAIFKDNHQTRTSGVAKHFSFGQAKHSAGIMHLYAVAADYL